MYFYYIYKNMGMCASGSFSKDRLRWIKFEQSEKNWLESSGNKPYGAKHSGVFVSVEKFN